MKDYKLYVHISKYIFTYMYVCVILVPIYILFLRFYFRKACEPNGKKFGLVGYLTEY